MTMKTYRCQKCGRKVSRRRGTTCPLLEIVPPGLFRKARYRCGGTLTRVDDPKIRKARRRQKRQQEGPAGQLAKAKEALKRNISRARSAMARVRTWERRVARLEKLVAAASVPATFDPATSGRGDRAIAFD